MLQQLCSSVWHTHHHCNHDCKDNWCCCCQYCYDTTVSEIIPKFGMGNLQATVDHILNWSNANNFKLNSKLKCKELCIDFCRKANVDIPALEVNTNIFETVKSAKVLGITLRGDLNWNDHVLDNITAKASPRIYLLKQLKCRYWPCISHSILLCVYTLCQRKHLASISC